MNLAFLEFCLILFGLYLITQIFLPMAFPKDFEKNWLFKKSKPKSNVTGNTVDKINALTKQKDELKNATNEVITETQTQLEDSKNLHNSAKKLK